MKSDRRHFLLRAAGALGALALGGCDRMSQSEWFPRVLGSAEEVNRRLHRLITSPRALAPEYTETDLSPVFPSNGTSDPGTPQYQALAANGFADWRLRVGGLVERPSMFSLDALRALPARTQITRHDCVEGWSAIAKWKGARLAALLEWVRPLPQARYVMFFCADPMGDGDNYYESIALDEAFHPQSILAYEWNDTVLPVRYGAPLRLRVERQLGYKMAKYVMAVALVDDFSSLAGGKGGYWEDRGYEWYAGI